MLETSSSQAVFHDFGSRPSKHHGSWPTKPQPLCGNKEGWGPLSPTRFDFTPCFLDVWIIVVAVFGIVLGSVAIWYLCKRRKEEPVPKDWHFYAKHVGNATSSCLIHFADFRILRSYSLLYLLPLLHRLPYKYMTFLMFGQATFASGPQLPCSFL